MVSDPQNSQLVLQFGDNSPGLQIINWEDYSYRSEFLVPCDGFTMRVGSDQITGEMRDMLVAGQKVQLYMQVDPTNGNTSYTNPIFTGYIDQVTLDTSRGGTFFTLRGRNLLGPLCDSGIDPWSNNYKFVDGQTMADVIGKCLNTFGISATWNTDVQNRLITCGANKNTAKLVSSTYKVVSDNIVVNNETITVSENTTTTTQTITQWIDPTNTFDLAEKSIKKLQPKHNQTFMEFIEENLARFGVAMWAMADGSGVVISSPDYIQEPLFNIINSSDGGLSGRPNNVVTGRLELDPFNMPSAIIAKGYQGGGDFQTTRIRTCKVNEFIGYPIIRNPGPGPSPVVVAGQQQNSQYVLEPTVQAVISRFKGLKPLDPNIPLIENYAQYFSTPAVPKIVFWEDEKSRTLDQLKAAVMRKMSEYQRNGFRLHYTVEDHTQNGLVWKHNTIVNVYDETLGIYMVPFWVLSVTFRKNRSTGTHTDLILIPVGSLILGPQ